MRVPILVLLLAGMIPAIGCRREAPKAAQADPRDERVRAVVLALVPDWTPATDGGEALQDDAYLALVREELRARHEIRRAGKDSARVGAATARLDTVLSAEKVLNGISY